MANMQALIESVTQVKVPLPFPLGWVNGYLIRGKGGFTVIDPGLHTAESKEVWEREIRQRGMTFADIEQIVLTHHHPDHYGLAGWMQQQSGAPVRMNRAGYEQAQMLWGAGQPLAQHIIDQFEQHGMHSEKLEQMKLHLDSFVSYVSPHPVPEFLEPGDTVRLGDDDYSIVTADGHAFGHLCFYDDKRHVLFCGDQVLPNISPNISLIPGLDPNPLHSFLHSLTRLSRLPVHIAYPGHRDPFTRFGERCLQLIAHHEERLSHIQKLLEIPLTGYELCLSLFGDRLPAHQLRFAMAETLAHTEYLKQRGLIAEERNDKKIAYRNLGARPGLEWWISGKKYH